jgi:hypothetical protein
MQPRQGQSARLTALGKSTRDSRALCQHGASLAASTKLRQVESALASWAPLAYC